MNSKLYDSERTKPYDQNIGNLSTRMTCLEQDKLDWQRWADQSAQADVIAQVERVVAELDALRDMVRGKMRR